MWSSIYLCLKISFDFADGYVRARFDQNSPGQFLITHQELIDANLTEEDIQGAKEAKNCDYYPSILDEYSNRIAALEKKVADLEGAGAYKYLS